MKPSRYSLLSGSPTGPSSKMLEKLSRLTAKKLAEVGRKSAVEKFETSEDSNLSEIYEFEVVPIKLLFTSQPEKPKGNGADGIELFEDSSLSSH